VKKENILKIKNYDIYVYLFNFYLVSSVFISNKIILSFTLLLIHFNIINLFFNLILLIFLLSNRSQKFITLLPVQNGCWVH